MHWGCKTSASPWIFFFLTRKLFSKYFPCHHHLDRTWVVWSQVFNSNLDHIWQVLLWHHSEPGGKSQWHTPAGPQISNCPSHAILKNSGRRRVNTDTLHLSILPQCLPLEKQMQFQEEWAIYQVITQRHQLLLYSQHRQRVKGCMTSIGATSKPSCTRIETRAQAARADPSFCTFPFSFRDLAVHQYKIQNKVFSFKIIFLLVLRGCKTIPKRQVLIYINYDITLGSDQTSAFGLGVTKAYKAPKPHQICKSCTLHTRCSPAWILTGL